MPRRREIRGVLGNLLSGLTSRYTDFDGYWLFGFIVGGTEAVEVDLLATDSIADDSPLGCLIQTARLRFQDQVDKSALSPDRFQQAGLVLTRPSEQTSGFFNGRWRSGYDVKFEAWAVSDLGRRYTHERTIFVAPHDPAAEHRSARPDRVASSPGI